ncbi:MAG: hypothetical protein ABSG19_12415 [Candidatus Aminicenantales bacterium]
MTEVEKWKKLRLEFEDVHGKLVGLPGKITALKMEASAARDESVRMELLGDLGAPAKRASIKAALDEVRKIESEREDLEHRRKILQSVMEEVKKKAEPELAAVHARTFARAVKALAIALRAAHKAEFELATVREEAVQAFGEIDSRDVPLPRWVPVLIRDLGSAGAMRPELVNFLEQMKGQGFDVS